MTLFSEKVRQCDRSKTFVSLTHNLQNDCDSHKAPTKQLSHSQSSHNTLTKLSQMALAHFSGKVQKIKVVVRELVRLNKNAHSKVDLMVTKYTYG